MKLERLRLRIIDWLNKDPEICWSKLIDWAYFLENHDFREIFHAKSYFHMKRGCSYCDKCAQEDVAEGEEEDVALTASVKNSS